ncbi:unnamed protein product, partial [Heterosigma akashiwo]
IDCRCFHFPFPFPCTWRVQVAYFFLITSSNYMAPPPPTTTDPPVEDPPSVPVLEESKSEEVIPCGICLFEDDRERNEAKMPCCYTEGSSIWYCSPCMKLLCDRS